jgi:hypothetical protein
MTIKEALTTKVAPLSISDAALDLALLEAGLDGASDYSPMTDGKPVDMVWAGLLLTTIQVVEVKEDDVSIKWSSNLRNIYSEIMRRWKLEDPFAIAKPTVRQINFH